MKQFRLFVILLTILCTGSAFALDLTVDDAVDMVLENNQSLKSSALDLKMAKDADDVSWNGFLPTVQTSATLSRSNAETNTKILTGFVNNPAGSGSYLPTYTDVSVHPTSLIGTASLSFAFNPALITNMKLAEQQYEAGEISYEQAKAQMVVNVKKLFYAILLQQESVKIQEETLEDTKARMDQAKDLYDKGYANELTYLQAEVGYENLKATTIKSRQAVAQQKDNLAFLLGLDGGEDLTLVGAIEPEFISVDLEESLSHIGQRYDVESLEKQMDILDTQGKALDMQTYVPSVSITASYQPTLGDITDDWFDGDNWMDRGSTSMTVAWNLTGLLPWSTQRQQAKTIEDNQKKMEINLAMTRDNARMEIKQLITTLAQSKEAIESSERSISLAQKSYDMTVEAYRSGTTELLDVRDSEAQLNQAKLGKLNEQYNYLSALFDLEYATKTTL